MKKFLYIVVVLFILGAWTPRVFAHKLAIDGSIGVTIHIDPDDEPRQGKESKIFLEITDAKGRFNPGNPSGCICVLSIVRGEDVLATLPVVNGATYTQLRYTFPDSGTYELIVDGKPAQGGGIFQAFRTRFEYYVAGTNETPQVNPLKETVPYVVVLAGMIIIILLYPMMPPARKNDKRQKSLNKKIK